MSSTGLNGETMNLATHPRTLLAILVGLGCADCRHYAASTPRTVHENDHGANFERIFGETPPPGVSVVNSVVITYASRPGVVTTDDFEFELLATRAWIDAQIEKWSLSNGLMPGEFERRKSGAKPWYTPKPADQYDAQRDASSVGYFHLLVDREPVEERFRVFASKH